MSYLDSQLMWKRNYPVEHEVTEERFKKLKRRSGFKELTFEQYAWFSAGDDASCPLLEEFESFDGEFVSRGQFLNWLIEKRLKDGRII